MARAQPKSLFFLFSGRPFVMAVCLKNGEILLLRSFDDVIPQVSLRFVKTFCSISFKLFAKKAKKVYKIILHGF